MKQITLADLQNKKLGMNILGGGMRSVAYAGMFKAFEEYNIKPYFIVGSSGGAVVGASYAFGKSAEDILAHFKKFQPLKLFNPITLIKKRQLNYESWLRHAAKSIPADTDLVDSNIKLAVRAVDIDKNDSEYMTSGSAIKSVIASSAILGGFSWRGHEYYDGDYDPETAVDFLKQQGAQLCMLIYVDPENINASLLKGYRITQQNALKSEIELHPPDLVYKIKSSTGSLLGKKHLEENYQAGYEQTINFLQSLEH